MRICRGLLSEWVMGFLKLIGFPSPTILGQEPVLITKSCSRDLPFICTGCPRKMPGKEKLITSLSGIFLGHLVHLNQALSKYKFIKKPPQDVDHHKSSQKKTYSYSILDP